MKQNETATQRMLSALAQVDPQYPAYVATLPDGLGASADVPSDLLENVATILREERPDLNKWFDAYAARETSGTRDLNHFGMGEVAGVAGIMTAMLFLLRTHILLKRDTDGKWIFTYEHKPADSDLLKKTIEALVSIFNKTKGS